jgi:alkylated DNA repair dioxygenase AlkB
MSATAFEELLRKAALGRGAEGPPVSKQALFMPQKYVELSRVSSSGLSREDDGGGVPDRIEGAVAPHSLIAIPGRLVKVHLENADIRYMSGLYSQKECMQYLRLLAWQDKSLKWERFGKGRSVVQWSKPGGMRYVFSDVEYIASEFPVFVEKIRQDVVNLLKPIYGEAKTAFNYCVCNCYTNGLAGVNWHTDSEPHLVPDCPIACVSFGSERVFSLAKLPRTVTESPSSVLNLRLESGSVVVMAGETQRHYLHAIAKETSVREPRFSLTFRVNYPPS